MSKLIQQEKRENIKIIEFIEKIKTNQIDIPSIQRGFVWKPYQIENLWDSMLRGYPIGAFTVQKNEENFSILDGQQRATALALGCGIFKGRAEADTSFKVTDNEYELYIDLYKPLLVEGGETDSLEREFFVRVTTKYHPWGYSFKENNKTLDSKNIKKALKYNNISDDDFYNGNYLNGVLENMYPYDSYIPIPLHMFFDSNSGLLCNNIEDIKKKVLSYLKKNNMENIYSFIIKNDIKNIENYVASMGENLPTLRLSLLKDDAQFYSIDDIYEKLKIAFQQYLAFIDINVNSITNIEHVFERINRGGTPITNEELNYSLFKSKLCQNAEIKLKINDFEKSCDIISHVQFLPIMFRLFQHIKKRERNIPVSIKISSKDFKRDVLADQEINVFFDFLSRASEFIKEFKSVVCYDKKNKNGLPYPLVVQLNKSAPELMFMFMFRRFKMLDNFDAEENKNKIIGLLTVLYWYFGGSPRKDYGKLLRILFPCMQLGIDRFYSYETLQRAVLNISDVNPEKLCEYFDDMQFSQYLNKDVLLYAQRQSLSSWFSEEKFNAADANRPFDYDHICPHSWIRKHKVNRELREIYHSNGNMRAWPYYLNRADHDQAPSIKLNAEASYIDHSLCHSEWSKIDDNHKNFVKQDKRSPELKRMITCIENRNIEIFDKWYKKLKIKKNFLTGVKVNNFKNIFTTQVQLTREGSDFIKFCFFECTTSTPPLLLYFKGEKGSNYITIGDISMWWRCSVSSDVARANVCEKFNVKYAGGYFSYHTNLVSLNPSAMKDVLVELYNILKNTEATFEKWLLSEVFSASLTRKWQCQPS